MYVCTTNHSVPFIYLLNIDPSAQVVGVVVKVFGVLRPESKQDERASKLQKKPVGLKNWLA